MREGKGREGKERKGVYLRGRRPGQLRRAGQKKRERERNITTSIIVFSSLSLSTTALYVRKRKITAEKEKIAKPRWAKLCIIFLLAFPHCPYLISRNLSCY